ncbi:MAG: hypothetical protein ACXV97_00795 [Chthoniobacterales bacterium]
MKSLDQIEPRTPISSLPFFIGQSGSYYLTNNFSISTGDSYGIFISASNVTVDLNGFTIRSFDQNNVSIGIKIDSSQFADFHDITILNGHIAGNVLFGSGVYSGTGFGYGIYSSGNPRNVRVSGVTVSGCLNDGINLGLNSSVLVESCAGFTAGGNGIYASTVSRCAAQQCGMYGVYAYSAFGSFGDSTSTVFNGLYANAAENCYGSSVGGGFISLAGLQAQAANNCYGYHSGTGGGGGLSASAANNCYGYDNGNGVALSATIAHACVGYAAGNGDGISAVIAGNSYGSSNGSGYGIRADVVSDCYGTSSTGIGVRYEKLGANSYGIRNSPLASNYVIGSGAAGPTNLP